MMRNKIAWLLFLASFATVRADDAIAKAQQSLKDQGFYYGQVTGEKDSVTTDAIRRFQIRNGLQVTGELNDETLRSLSSTTAASSPKPAATVAPAPKVDNSDLRDDNARNDGVARGEQLQPFAGSPRNRDQSVVPGAVVPSSGGLFAGTPYETAPPEVQRKVIMDAQRILVRRGLFKNEVDGLYGPNLEFSLRAYQSRVGLQPTGRLDLETLAALELLPGAQMPIFRPRRGFRPPRPDEPPVRGEWVRPP